MAFQTYASSDPRLARAAAAPAGFMRGALDVWRGLGFLIGRPSLWVWALIPFLVSVGIYALCFWLGWHYFSPWLNEHLLAAHAGGWRWFWDAVAWLARILFWCVLALVAVFTFIPAAALVAAPFNDILSEKVEFLYAGRRAARFAPGRFARSLWLSISHSLWLTILTLCLLALTLPLHLLPGVGSIVASILAAAISIWFLSLQFTAYSMDRRLYTFAQRAAFQRRHRARSLGLGAMSFAIMLVPVANALFIPVSAVAGTLLFCDAEGE